MSAETTAVAAAAGPALEMDGLSVSYGRTRVIDGLTLAVPRGSVFALLGRNGAGKSSLLRVLLGQRPPAKGRVRLLGEDPWPHRTRLMARIGVVPEEPDAPPEMTSVQLSAFCARQSQLLYRHAQGLGLRCHQGGTLVCMEGPAFSTRAESEYHRRMGYAIIGMTALPEAKLAREAEICYSSVSLVTDYDCWKDGEEVSSSQVLENLSVNVTNAQRLIARALAELAALPRDCRCAAALSAAIFTNPEHIDRRTARRLGPIVAKRLKIRLQDAHENA